MIHTLLYFTLALVLLITVHEFGHFIVARYCGVKVLRFSFGFGKILARFQDRRGTEYAWSLFPLGGYVKMLDESEEEVPAHERHLAFNNKSVWARMAIIAAGPLFNFIFAFAALWLLLVIGIQSLAPMIDDVKPGSIAARAGLKPHQEILMLNDRKIASWRDFQYALMPMLGTDEPITLRVQSRTDGQQSTVTLPLRGWELDVKKPDMLASFGITPFVPSLPAVVGEVVTDSPAGRAGLAIGDQIVSVDGKPVTDWLELVDYVRQRPEKSIALGVKRQGRLKTIDVLVAKAVNDGRAEGFIGLRSQRVEWPAHWLRLHREGPLEAIGTAFKQTVELSTATFTLIGRLITGKLSLQSISGPVGIAQGAGESARSGLAYYLSFLALVSISLGVLNLLPIPMLDGGQLLYCILEIIRGRPLSDGAKSVGIYLGLVLLLALMVVGLTNDLSRLAG